MFEIPYTYSLGPEARFSKLAAIARDNREWRKVARLVGHYMKLKTNRFSKSRGNDEIEAKMYLARALRDTKISITTQLAICELYGLEEVATAIKERHAARLRAMCV